MKKIKCKICGIERLNLQNHIRHFHKISCSDYKKMFPKEKLRIFNDGVSEKVSRTVKKLWKDGVYDNKKKMDTKELSKRIKAGLVKSEKQKNKISFRPSFLSKEKQIERSKKISKALKKYALTHEIYNKNKKIEELFGDKKAKEIRTKIREKRAKQIFPKGYTSIENSIYDKLLQLNLAGYFMRNKLIGKYNRFDFVSEKYKIAIECDGDYWHGKPEKYTELNKMQIHNQKNDERKNKIAKDNGFLVLRFWGSDIDNDMEDVGYCIQNYCNRGGFNTNET